MSAILILVFGCSSGSSNDAEGNIASASQAILGSGGRGGTGGNSSTGGTGGGLSNAGLQLQVFTASCVASQVQQHFRVVNNGTSAVKSSDIKIKFWVHDTSGSNVIGTIYAGGCLTGTNGCYHQVSGVLAAVTNVAPACGPDANHQANKEITISSTDNTLLGPGQSWDNVQMALHLGNWGNFNPGTNTWYSPCLSGSNYAPNNYFGVYYKNQLVFSSGIAAPDCRAPHGSQHLDGHVTQEMRDASLDSRVPGDTVLSLSIGLPVSVPPPPILPLENFVQDVSDPNGPNYRRYIDVPTFASRYGSPRVGEVASWATARGLTVVETLPNHLMVSVRGTAAAIEQALYVDLNYYLRPDGTKFYAPDREPSVDTDVPLLEIGHLNDLFVMKPASGSGNNGLYFGDDVRKAYGFDPAVSGQTTLTGDGQCVGLMGADGFSLGDMAQYWSNAGRVLPMPNVTAVNADGADHFTACNELHTNCNTKNPNTNTPLQCGPSTKLYPGDGQNHCRPDLPAHMACCGVDFNPQDPNAGLTECYVGCPPQSACETSGSPCPGSPGGEMTIDIQMVLAMAPKANIVIYEGNYSDNVLTHMTTASTLCHQLSTSWTFGTSRIASIALFELAAQGQSLFYASGDWSTTSIHDFANSEYITDVGALDLTMNGNGASFSSESGIGASGSWIADGNTADGCGDVRTPSAPIPRYQQGVTTGNGASGTYRNVPDVSIVGSSLEVDTNGQRLGGLWGSSFSAPLWAGFMALVNEQNSHNGLGPVGFANPVFYGIAKSRGTATDVYSSTFHDVEMGSTDSRTCSRDPNTGKCGCTFNAQPAFWAGPGYDIPTGLGSPTFGLIQQLASQSPLPPTGIAAGGAHACVIRNDGSVWCWGWNADGQLGNGLVDLGGPCPGDAGHCDIPFNPHPPSPVMGLYSRAIAISANYATTCAVVSGGTVWCWGFGYGPLPVQVNGVQNASYVAVGGLASCVMMADGTVQCWGKNSTGQLGNGTNTDSATPVNVVGISDAVAIRSAPMAWSTCAQISTGGVECWGDNTFGQLGNGTFADSNVPVSVVELPTDVASIAVSLLNACAVLVDGRVACWGDNRNGQLGDGTTNDSSVPVIVSGLTNAREVAIGDASICAVLTDDTVTCWGSNLFYQLGDGSTDSTEVTMQAGTKVQSLTDLVPNSQWVQSIAGGSHDFYCAAVKNGVACWGHDLAGALGDNSNTDRNVPIMARLIQP